MRTRQRNKVKLKYSLFSEKVAQYYTDSQGNQIPTGTYTEGYSIPVDFFGNLSMSGSGIANETEYGIDITNYRAILIMEKDEVPLDENSIIWFESEPTYLDVAKTKVDGDSCDYRIAKVSPSMHFTKYILVSNAK